MAGAALLMRRQLFREQGLAVALVDLVLGYAEGRLARLADVGAGLRLTIAKANHCRLQYTYLLTLSQLR